MSTRKRFLLKTLSLLIILAGLVYIGWIVIEPDKIRTSLETGSMTELESQSTIESSFIDFKTELCDNVTNEKLSCTGYSCDLNCSLVFEGIPEVLKKAKGSLSQKKWSVPTDTEFYKYANCDWIKKQLDRPYYVSEHERQFPLAFALTVYDSPYQIFRFLKVIYRQHNLYCIHYDQKSTESFKKLMGYMSTCVPNVIVPSKMEEVVWGWHTIVDAQISCMEELYKLRHKFRWKYVITLCGKEVPLRTNREIVNTLRKLNGTSAVDLEKVLKHEYKYWKLKYMLTNKKKVVSSNRKLGPIPLNLKIAKSMAYFGLSQVFTNFILHNEIAINFRHFMAQTKIPDEHFIATLFNTKGLPGGKDEKYSHLIPTTSSYIWLVSKEARKSWKKFCNGINVHNVCVVSNADLYKLDYKYKPNNQHQTFFHNKFFIKEDRIVIDCAEELLINRNREECLKDFNI